MVFPEPFATPIDKPIFVAPCDTHVVTAKIDQTQARAAVRAAVRDGVLRPFDIGRAEVEEPRPIWVPFWRFEITIPDLLAQAAASGAEEPALSPSKPAPPSLSLLVPARSDIPYTPRIPSILAAVSGVEPLVVLASEMTSPSVESELTENDAKVLSADVDVEKATEIATGLVRGSFHPASTLAAKYLPTLGAPLYCLYPIYYARFSYEGEARRHPGESFVVAVSGRTGKVVFATFPSVVRSMAAKVRRLLSFDRRI